MDLLLDHLTTPAWREEGKNGVVENYKSTVKRHFYVREKFMRICKNGPLDKFMRSSTLCVVTYGAIKFMRYKHTNYSAIMPLSLTTITYSKHSLLTTITHYSTKRQ